MEKAGDFFVNRIATEVTNLVIERLEKMLAERQRLLDVGRAAEYLGLSESALYSLVATRKLQSVRFDKRHRFDIRDLDKFIDDLKMNGC